MKRFFTLSSLLFLLAAAAGAQDIREAIRQDRYLAAGNHHPYIVPEFRDTPAPKGFKPFYVSHYGRHGSRYHVSEAYFNKVVPMLDSLERAGLLTVGGQSLRRDILQLYKESEGLFGVLTQVGGKEHQGIASRLYKRCPGIFKQKDRPGVLTVSSTVHRCLQSAANFNLALKAKAPQLDIEIHTGDRYMTYIAHRMNSSKVAAERKRVTDSLTFADVRLDVTGARLFSDVERAAKLAGGENELKTLLYNLYGAGTICMCLDGQPVDIFRHFTNKELAVFAKINNAHMAAAFNKSRETGLEREHVTGGPLLQDFVDKADAALAGNGRCADFRFGHDTGIGPILSILRVEGYDKIGPLGESLSWWPSWKYIPMGSNLQMIFYRNKAGEVLVKLLRNEEETTIPAVPSYDGPYYKWSDLRAYCLKRIAD